MTGSIISVRTELVNIIFLYFLTVSYELEVTVSDYWERFVDVAVLLLGVA